jgi:hypothetical protein
VEVLPSGKGNRAYWSDHGKVLVVSCSGDRKKKKGITLWSFNFFLVCFMTENAHFAARKNLERKKTTSINSIIRQNNIRLGHD